MLFLLYPKHAQKAAAGLARSARKRRFPRHALLSASIRIEQRLSADQSAKWPNLTRKILTTGGNPDHSAVFSYSLISMSYQSIRQYRKYNIFLSCLSQDIYCYLMQIYGLTTMPGGKPWQFGVWNKSARREIAHKQTTFMHLTTRWMGKIPGNDADEAAAKLLPAVPQYLRCSFDRICRYTGIFTSVLPAVRFTTWLH